MASAPDKERLQENVAGVRQAIADACARAGRDADGVTLVAVTKYVDLPVIQALLAAGVADIGENRVQQLTARAEELGALTGDWPGPAPGGRPDAARPAPRPRWHMVGHLQRNKVKALLPHSSIVHSLDSARLAAEIERVAARLDTPVDALIEINVTGEASKFGVRPAELEAHIAALRPHSHVRLRGLMTMAPFDPDPEHARPHFARLRQLLERLRATGTVGPDCVHLSMGMSQDYAVAVEEGATLVRVGSALYEGFSP